MHFYLTKKRKNHARSIKKCLLLLFLLLSGISAGAQNNLFYGYVGDLINLPDPPDRGDWKFYTAGYFTDSENLSVDGTTGMVSILKYFEDTEIVQCDYRVYRTYTIGTQMYTDWQTLTTYFYIRCNPVVLTGLPNQISLKVGESYKITYSASPYSHWPQVDFIADDPNIITVDSYGKVTGMSEGNTYITVMNSKGPNEAVFVYVTEDSNPVVYADVESGEVIKGTEVTLTCNKSGADIYYTTDGTSPSNSSTRYSSPIVINTTLTLKAIAYYDGKQSSILSRNYTVDQNNGEGLPIVRNCLTAGSYHSMFIKADGTLWACGNNGNGQIGDGTTTDRTTPIKVMDNVASVSAGSLHSLILKNDGTLWTCGCNDEGQLCDGSNDDRSTPIKVMGNVASIAAGSYFSLILKKDGTLWTCGENDSGQLGDGTTTNRTTPVKVLSNVIAIAAGGSHTLALKKDGTLWGCGENYVGQLGDHDGKYGDGGKYDWYFKNFVKISDDVISIFTDKNNYGTTFMIKSDGILWACGNNDNGRLGTGGPSEYYVRTPIVTGMEDVASVSGGWGHSLFLKNDGSVFACGDNRDGQLGNGNYSNEPVTAPIEVMEEVVSMAAGGYFSLFLKKDGTLLACGNNEYGQLGDGTTTRRAYEFAKVAEGVGLTIPDYEVTLSSAGYATFYSTQSAYILPNGLTAGVVTSVSGNKLTYRVFEDNVIPKGVAVMIESSSKQARTYTLTPTDSDVTYTGTNLLQGSDEATTTTGEGYHYKLSYGPSGTEWSNVFGWYWGAQNGAPFQIEGHKAWLVVPKLNGTRSYPLEEDATKISDVDIKDAKNAVFYDLQGRRIGQPIKKGIYIRNGKKVLVN